MSRSAIRDNSTAVTLFPFLAVLLCTMGSLVMILVVVAKVSRDKAVERAEAERAARVAQAPLEVDENAIRQLKLANERLSQLDRAKRAAEKTLRNDQLRLQHIEDHMRRLEEQLESLQLASAELNAMEEEHFDDRMQAIREVDRLQQLIEDTREQIVELESEQEEGPRSYSIIPYKGPHGTARQPIYIECLKNEVVLQPEGIRLKPQDFIPPLGAGNPLASALRAAREFKVNQNPNLGESADTEPYPLILVRPAGIGAYYQVRAAIESWDADFGYELIGEDWKLDFPDSNPELATVEARAIESARRRQKMLMAAAPNAYGRGYSALAAGSFDMGSDRRGDSFEESGPSMGAAGESGAGSMAQQARAERFAGMGHLSSELRESSNGEEGSGGEGRGAGDNQPTNDESQSGESGDSYAMESGGPQLSPASAAGQSNYPSTTQQQDSSEAKENFVSLGTIPNRQAKQGEAEAGASGAGSENEPGQPSSSASGALASSGGSASGSPSPGGGGQDSSGSSSSASLSFSSSGSSGSSGGSQPFTGSNPNDVPVRRAVQIVVRHDRVAILPERTGNTKADVSLTGGKVILLEGDTSLAVDRIVSGLQEHVQNWGIAGRGHFWRPVLMLNVGPDGIAQAEELTALLKRSGLELRHSTTAQHSDPGNAKTTR